MNWKHSFYQLHAITFGQAFTVDEAYRLLCEQREDRQFSIASAFAETKRAKAKVIDAKRNVDENRNTPAHKSHLRRSEAAILETEARFIIAQPCLDMARAELAFIESLIAYIDNKGLRLHEDPVFGAQAVQPLEYAYDLLWTLIHDGSSGDVMRNVWANPYAIELLDTYGELTQPPPNAFIQRAVIAEKLAKRLRIEYRHLAVSVKHMQYDNPAILGLGAYAAAHIASVEKLGEKVNAELSGVDRPGVGVESAT